MQKRKWYISLLFIVIFFTLGLFLVPSIIVLLFRKRAKRYLRIHMEDSGVDALLPNYQQKGELIEEIEVPRREKNEDGIEERFPAIKNVISKQTSTTTQEPASLMNTDIDEELTMQLDTGLSLGELLLLNWYRNSNKLTTDLPPRDILYNYGLDDNNLDYVTTLISKGFLRVSNMIESLTLLKVVELKESLKSYSLKVSGKKQDLIERLMENLAKEDLEKITIRRSYILTEKGERALEEYEDPIEVHQNKEKNEGIES